jgi:hypothetical protein
MIPSKFVGLSAEALFSEKSAEMLLAESLPIETILSEFSELFAGLTAETLLAVSLSVERIPSNFAELSVEALFPEMSVEMFLMSVEKLLAGSLTHLRQTKLPSSFVEQDR